MNEPPARIGAPIDEIDTPALVLDLDAFEQNLERMAAFARSAGVRLRPHAKTHKCPTIALLQIAAGAVGQCCQKVGEAEVLVRGGVRDVLVSNEIVDPQKLRRLAALANDATIALCFDAAESVDAASRAAREAGVELAGLVEIEVGMQRCGIAPGQPAADLARRIAHAGLRSAATYHAPPSTCPRWPSARRDRGSGECRANDDRRIAEIRTRVRTRQRRGDGDLPDRGQQRRLERIAGGIVFVHGHRLRPDRRPPWRALPRLRAQPLRARDSDERPAADRAIVDAG
jgi:D-serine deaminase-like pyridoxal phosphate-dependent protein